MLHFSNFIVDLTYIKVFKQYFDLILSELEQIASI